MRLERVFVNLDVEHVRRLLRSIALQFEAGLSGKEVEEFCTLLESGQDWRDLMIEPIVRFDGQELPFIVDVLDEASAVFEIVFVTAPAISQVVQREVSAQCAGVTPRVIPA